MGSEKQGTALFAQIPQQLFNAGARQGLVGTRQVSTDSDPQLARAVDILRGSLIFSERNQTRRKNPAGKGS